MIRLERLSRRAARCRLESRLERAARVLAALLVAFVLWRGPARIRVPAAGARGLRVDAPWQLSLASGSWAETRITGELPATGVRTFICGLWQLSEKALTTRRATAMRDAVTKVSWLAGGPQASYTL